MLLVACFSFTVTHLHGPLTVLQTGAGANLGRCRRPVAHEQGQAAASLGDTAQPHVEEPLESRARWRL